MTALLWAMRTGTGAVVRKPPGKEPAGDGAVPPGALWGFGCSEWTGRCHDDIGGATDAMFAIGTKIGALVGGVRGQCWWRSRETARSALLTASVTHLPCSGRWASWRRRGFSATGGPRHDVSIRITIGRGDGGCRCLAALKHFDDAHAAAAAGAWRVQGVGIVNGRGACGPQPTM